MIDFILPHENGLSIARRLRAALPQIGMVMLTARTSQENTLGAQRENLRVLVSRLRSKLDDAMPHKGIIKSVRSYGYKLTVRMLVVIPIRQSHSSNWHLAFIHHQYTAINLIAFTGFDAGEA